MINSILNRGDRFLQKDSIRRNNQYSIISIQELYERPGQIINKDIYQLDDDYDIELKNNLQEMYDYVKVNLSAWKFFKRWYN